MTSLPQKLSVAPHCLPIKLKLLNMAADKVSLLVWAAPIIFPCSWLPLGALLPASHTRSIHSAVPLLSLFWRLVPFPELAGGVLLLSWPSSSAVFTRKTSLGIPMEISMLFPCYSSYITAFIFWAVFISRLKILIL